jgi:3D (Asp-Asp-Asp) domain-containing protein
MALDWEIQTNLHGDKLPIIPTGSNVQAGKILYRLKIKLTLHTVSNGTPAAEKLISIQSSNAGDTISLSPAVTDASGVVMLTLETRTAGDRQLSVTNSDITANPLSVSLSDAWYESKFLITGYNVCDESDFTGAMTVGVGLGDQHRYNFLFSASGVIMQGTGRALNGRLVRYVHMTTTWHYNAAHHRDHIIDPAGVTFAYTDGVHGAYGLVSENHSIAVDARVIPPRARVNIEGVGDRSADDRGSAINGYHIDNFLGAGQAVVTQWLHGGVNGTRRKVKYKG